MKTNLSIKIGFFNSILLEYGGGTAKYLIETAGHLKKKFPNTSISIITFDEKLSKRVTFLYFLYFWGGFDKNKLYKESTDRILKELSNIKYVKVSSFTELRTILLKQDVVYSKNDILECIILKMLVGYSKLPKVVLGFHTPICYQVTSSFHAFLHNILYGSFFYTFLIKECDIFHVINSYDQQLLKNRFPTKKIVKIYNPIVIKESLGKSYRRKYVLRKKIINIMWIGRLTEQKGIEKLILLVESLNKIGYKETIQWNIAGEGENRDKIIKLSKKWKNVRYFGYIENRYIPFFLKQGDLLINTSKWEGLPYSLLEAQLLGLPVIAFNISGCNEIVTDGTTGYLVESLEEFSQKIVSFINKKSFYKDQIKEITKKKFPQENMYEKVYNMLVYD